MKSMKATMQVISSRSHSVQRSTRHATAIAVLGLCAATIVAFAGVWRADFVNYDDPGYVTDNPQVRAGLTLAGLWWDLTTTYFVNWHPLTWASFQADYELYGLAPAGYHLTNLLLHLANALLLFAFLRRATGAVWRSALVAGLFALHPLHVESVAWVSERKDVLSTFFCMLTLWAYAGYVQQPGLARYLLVAGSLALGLMAKPMLVTLPFVMLLLDYWPFERLDLVGSPRRSVAWIGLEKVPFLAMAAASAVVTLVAQQRGWKANTLAGFPLRLENAAVSAATYLRQMVWPVGLVPFYPLPREHYPAAEVAAAVLLLTGITGAVVWGRRHRYLLVGWLWYLGTLVPVLGLVHVLGGQARADRYTYVPLVGIFLMLAWGLGDLVIERPGGKRRVPRDSGRSSGSKLAQRAAVVGAIVVLTVCLVLTRLQVGYWQSSQDLWEHTLQVDRDNYLALNNLGMVVLTEEENPQLAEKLFMRAIQVQPNGAYQHYGLGMALEKQGRLAEALKPLAESLRLDPESADARLGLGAVAHRLGQEDQAIAYLTEALRRKPEDPQAQNILGAAYAQKGELDLALRHLKEALRLRPKSVPARANLGMVYLRQGAYADAVNEFQETRKCLQESARNPEVARKQRPVAAETAYQLGVAYERAGNREAALACFREAVELAPALFLYHCGLAHALHAHGDVAADAEEYRLASKLQPGWPEQFRKEAWRLATDPDSHVRYSALAVELAEKAAQAANPPDPAALEVLAAAYAEAGRFDEAIATTRQALAIGSPQQVSSLQARLHLYETHRPFREETTSQSPNPD
jgi:tetratricopeptide (TPR) repeat protein